MSAGVGTDNQGKVGTVSHSRASLTIVLSKRAEAYLNQLGEDLVTGAVELWQLSPALHQFWVFAYSEGAASRQPEIDQANDSADRYYSQLFCPRVHKKQGATFEELEAIRHEIYTKHDQAGSAAA